MRKGEIANKGKKSKLQEKEGSEGWGEKEGKTRGLGLSWGTALQFDK